MVVKYINGNSRRKSQENTTIYIVNLNGEQPEIENERIYYVK